MQRRQQALGPVLQSRLDTNPYQSGRVISDDELAAVSLRKHAFHGEWNYSILPRPSLKL